MFPPVVLLTCASYAPPFGIAKLHWSVRQELSERAIA